MKNRVRFITCTMSVLLLQSLLVTSTPVRADTFDTTQPVVTQTNQEYEDQELSGQVDNLLKQGNFCGTVLIIKDGKPVYTKSMGYADYSKKLMNKDNSSYEIDSIQKSLTAGLIMKLVQEHKMSLDDKLAKYFPEIPGSHKITIRQMLDMKSGLTLSGDGPTVPLPDAQIANDDAHSLYYSNVMYNKWQYSPINFVLLARIVEKVSHKNYKQIFTETYIKKLHLKETTFAYGSSNNVNKSQGYTNNNPLSGRLTYANPYITKAYETRDEFGTGQVFMSPGDLYKAERYLVSGDMLTNKSRQELFVPASISTYGGGLYNHTDSRGSNGWGYGYQSVFHISDSGNTAVVVMSNYQRLANNVKPLANKIFSLALSE
ncbi:serine hydrolase domain-containing protein [Companilactobacillus mishanensis]|nr:serine hydrolase domain-containing protein [Companilactobacillus mishanensis]